MSKDSVLLIGVDLGKEKDCQCATLNLHYNKTDHIIYQTTDKEQVAVLNEIMEEVNKEKTALQRLESIDNANPSEAMECLEKLGTHRIEYWEGFELGSTRTMPFKSTMEYKIIKQALQQKITWKHIHNTKVRVPWMQIINGKTQEEKYQIIEDIYYTWEEKKEALEDKNNELEQENAGLRAKTQRQDRVLKIIKEKCLYNDNLNYVAVCINYGMYKEKMSRKHNTEVVKIDWNDIELLDYLKLLTKEEFIILKRYCDGKNL